MSRVVPYWVDLIWTFFVTLCSLKIWAQTDDSSNCYFWPQGTVKEVEDVADNEQSVCRSPPLMLYVWIKKKQGLKCTSPEITATLEKPKYIFKLLDKYIQFVTWVFSRVWDLELSFTIFLSAPANNVESRDAETLINRFSLFICNIQFIWVIFTLIGTLWQHALNKPSRNISSVRIIPNKQRILNKKTCVCKL